MTLRLRVISIFTISFIFVFIFVFILFYLFFQFSDQRILTATLLGQSSTWLKVQEATHQQMLFHAYDESPGKVMEESFLRLWKGVLFRQ